MNVKVVAIIAVLVLLGLGGGMYMMSQNKPSTQTIKPTQSSQELPTANPKKSLKELLMSGISQQCSYSDTNVNSSIQGTSYIASGKVRNDYTSTVDGKTITGHMIVNNKVGYMWTEGETTGAKMAFDPENVNVDSSTEQNQQVDVNKTLDYSCTPWLVNEASFTPPTSVTFTDLSAMMQVQTTGSVKTDTNAAACSACNSLSGDAQAQCKTALNCK